MSFFYGVAVCLAAYVLFEAVSADIARYRARKGGRQ